MAITSERFEGTKNRNWLSSVHGISTAPTFHCSIVGTVDQDTLIPSGSPVVLHVDGTAEVVAPGGTVPAFAAGDQLGLTVSDRLPDLVDEEFVLNAATLMHGRIRYSFLGEEAKAAIDAAVSPDGEAVGASHEFVIHRQ